MIDLRRIQGLPPLKPDESERRKAPPQAEEAFNRVLEKAQESSRKLHFSAHALQRMAQRGIELTPGELNKVQDAVENAARKGARSSLVLLDESAFVISIANRTVITAMDSEGMKEQMVTDIDSAVIL